jgi:hypothetical protein
MNAMFKTLDGLKQQGFVGFVTISELRRDQSSIPEKPGVYLVIYSGANIPALINPGTGGFFKGKNPNVSSDTLMAKWVKGTNVIYIGKAGGADSNANLRKRLRQYFRFGQGFDVGHYGGRLIWQIKNSKDLLVCWKPLNTESPREVESQMIQEFIMQYGKMPFANLVS